MDIITSKEAGVMLGLNGQKRPGTTIIKLYKLKPLAGIKPALFHLKDVIELRDRLEQDRAQAQAKAEAKAKAKAKEGASRTEATKARSNPIALTLHKVHELAVQNERQVLAIAILTSKVEAIAQSLDSIKDAMTQLLAIWAGTTARKEEM